MEYKLLGISGLILIILLLTWLKDGKHMNPPIERRAIIDTTTNSANPETYLGGTWERNDKSQQKLAAAPNNGTSVAGAAETATSGGDKAHNNMQPYISVYIWRRMA